MKWYSTLHSSTSFEKSVRQVIGEVKEIFGAEKADLGLLFVSAGHRPDLIDLWPTLKKDLAVKHLVGCTAGGVIGGGNEVEQEPAVSLTVAHLPDVEISPFQIQQEDLPDGDRPPRYWRDLVKITPEKNPSFLIFSDPFSIDSDALLAGLDYAFPNAVKVGGLASGGLNANENLLMLDEKIVSRGTVGVALSGDIAVEAIVAQGCRPIGKPLSITSAEGNILLGVDNQPPLAYIQDLYETLKPRDQELLQTSLFLGIMMDSFTKNPKQGDFLIRNIIGLDQSKGYMAIGAGLRAGQTVQFHLRDAVTSQEDLRQMLTGSKSVKIKNQTDTSGAVLFSCVGRGRRLYGKPNHDSLILKSVVGDIPVGGFFCNGEIGPVGGRTYLHGYTSSIAVFSTVKETETAAKKEETHP